MAPPATTIVPVGGIVSGSPVDLFVIWIVQLREEFVAVAPTSSQTVFVIV